MTGVAQNRIAVFVPGAGPLPDLETLVQMVVTLFAQADFQQRGVSFDCDDIACLDFDAMRIALTVQASNLPDQPPQIAIGVGQVPGAPVKPTVLYEKFADRLSTILAKAIGAQAVLWCHRSGPLTPATLDGVLDEAAQMRDDLIAQMNLHLPKPERTSTTPTPMQSAAEQEARMEEFRNYLIESQNEAISTSQMRAAIYVLCSTLLIIAPPLGATLFAYCTLRETEDFELDSISMPTIKHFRLGSRPPPFGARQIL